MPSFRSSSQLYLLTTVFSLNIIFLSWHHLRIIMMVIGTITASLTTYSATRNTCLVCTPFPLSLRPILKFVSSSNESQLTPIISRYWPYVSNHSTVTFDPLQMIPVDSRFSSCLQYCIISPMNLARRKGSPPEMLILTMPASARSLRPRLASSRGTVLDEVSV